MLITQFHDLDEARQQILIETVPKMCLIGPVDRKVEGITWQNRI